MYIFIPYLINNKIGFFVYQPISSLLRIFLDINLDICDSKAKTYFTFIANVAKQKQNKKVGIEYESHQKIEFAKKDTIKNFKMIYCKFCYDSWYV